MHIGWGSADKLKLLLTARTAGKDVGEKQGALWLQSLSPHGASGQLQAA